ncbi:hypothetical protein TVAG_293570 [Trichomonas vaginalis G3]|uniref:Right handed beta helix domain-containing protein n=1 Tax=Trichomonas vaginalis (strain ATCC PRA-98 / G3) TaxID=412133 RepID=A2FCN0_TRIV3|nr:hypothetical protein TVAG_293570 [Trichomonas vaginalis G3]|eukprot:XP_001310282.1 hypothetical protein [Trichomonas vaginalis G3]
MPQLQSIILKWSILLRRVQFFNEKDQVININSVNDTLLLHNRCSFRKCVATGERSCVYFSLGRNNSIVQRKFCCTKCQSEEGPHFTETIVDSSVIIQSSLFDVGNLSTGNSISLQDEDAVVSSTNFSSCKTFVSPAGSLIGRKFQPSKYNYTTVVNNLATENSIIHLFYSALIDSCNIINNSILQLTQFAYCGIIYHRSSDLTIKSCSFINNTVPDVYNDPNAGSYLIYNDRYNDPSEEMLIENCYIDNSISTTQMFNYYHIEIREPFTNNLIHFSTDICQAEFAIINKSISEVNDLSLFLQTLLNISNSS